MNNTSLTPLTENQDSTDQFAENQDSTDQFAENQDSTDQFAENQHSTLKFDPQLQSLDDMVIDPSWENESKSTQSETSKGDALQKKSQSRKEQKKSRTRKPRKTSQSIIPSKRQRKSSNSSSFEKKETKFKARKYEKKTVLKLFKTLKGYPSKYDNIRTCIIRKFKKKIRNSLKKSSNQKTEIIPCNTVEGNFNSYVEEKRDDLSIIAQTENGPNTDGKTKRKGTADYNSCNNEYLTQLFKSDTVKRAYLLYIQLVFKDIDCAVLRKSFNIEPIGHYSEKCESKKCSEAWKELKNYYSNTMFTDLSKTQK